MNASKITYTARQRAYFRELGRDRRGGSVRDGTASVLCYFPTKGTCSVPLHAMDPAKLHVRVSMRDRGFLVFEGGDDTRVHVRQPPEGPALQLREIAAEVRRVIGDRTLGVRATGEIVDGRIHIFEIGAFELPVEPPLPSSASAIEDAPPAEPEPVRALGRADFTERREARIERLEDAAARKRSEAASSFKRIEDIASIIPLGQPILVGHHSEKRNRRDLKRIDAGMRRGVAAQREAAELERAAQMAARNDAISSDDPEVLTKLRAKLAALEAERAQIKATNTACRKGDPTALAVATEACRHTPWHDPKRGLPAYVLTNLGANIRRIEGRIAELVRAAARPERAPLELGGWTLRENTETNRVEIRTPGRKRCTEDEYRAIKGSGFRWARTQGAFVRQLNDHAWNVGVWLLERLTKTAASAAE